MESGWLLADGEAVASVQRARSPLNRHSAVTEARRGGVAAVLRGPSVLRGPVDVIAVRDGVASGVRTSGRLPVLVARPQVVVVVRHGDAARHGVRAGSAVELRWAT